MLRGERGLKTHIFHLKIPPTPPSLRDVVHKVHFVHVVEVVHYVHGVRYAHKGATLTEPLRRAVSHCVASLD